MPMTLLDCIYFPGLQITLIIHTFIEKKVFVMPSRALGIIIFFFGKNCT